MLIGYARVSNIEQNLDRQLDSLVSYGIDNRNIYKEKLSGKTKNRPELIRMIDELKLNDTVVVTDITRISRSTKDLLDIVDQIKNKGACIKSLKDTWLDTTSNNPYNEFLLTVMAGLSQLERDLISQRTKEGLAAAKARGRNGGRPSKRNSKAKLVETLASSNYKIKDIIKETGLSRTTIYRVLSEQ
ncbi:MAG: recombinase family protein [Clostridiaceae bacterium]|nr:recombinase family protein [Clostridiaceae bacterium]